MGASVSRAGEVDPDGDERRHRVAGRAGATVPQEFRRTAKLLLLVILFGAELSWVGLIAYGFWQLLQLLGA
jgi:hypothetical protein